VIQIQNVPFPKGFLSPLLHKFSQGNHVGFKPYPLLGTHDSVEFVKEHYRNEFDLEKRLRICLVIRDQYKNIELTPAQENNLYKLSQNDGYTVTTGQQIHPFLGPQFVYNKIFTAIITAKELNAVPVFWMATEDHDFDEIRDVHFLGKTYRWETTQSGAVGSFTTEGILDIIDQIKLDFPTDLNVQSLLSQLRDFYGSAVSLADATRRVVQHFWGHTGLLCLDPMNDILKQDSTLIFENEINGVFKAALDNHHEELRKNEIPVSIPSRNTHLFYFPNDSVKIRLRIDWKSDHFETSSQGFSWLKDELIDEIKAHPGRFSPNVLLRPIYQQNILPNLVYIAGPSEFMYWLELGNTFEVMNVIAPRLQLRLSSLFVSKPNQKKINGLEIDINDVFDDSKQIIDLIRNRFNSDSKLDQIQEELGLKYENLWNELYQLKIPELKSLKKTHQQNLKEIKTIATNYRNGFYGENPLSKALKNWEGLNRDLFSRQVPQERKEFFLESLIKYKINEIEIDDLPNLPKFLIFKLP